MSDPNTPQLEADPHADRTKPVIELDAVGAKAKFRAHAVAGLSRLTLSTVGNTEVKWRLLYK